MSEAMSAQALWQASQTPDRIVTDRLFLDLMRPYHAAELFHPLQQSSLYTFIPQLPPKSIPELKERYESLAKMTSPEDNEVWLNWIALEKTELQPVGTFEASVSLDGKAEIAYFVFDPFKRSGYAREGGETILACLVERFRVKQVSARIDSENLASIALVESLGFTREGFLYKADQFKGRVSHEWEYRFCKSSERPKNTTS